MRKLLPQNSSEISGAYLHEERAVWISNFRVACVLAIVFTLAGSILDLLVYQEHAEDFFKLRLMCAGSLLFIWWFVKNPIGQKFYRVLGLTLPALPSFFVSIMIYKTGGANSLYYAALNLVLLGAAIILRWRFIDTLIIFAEALGFYLAACFLQGEISAHHSIFLNNVFFIVVTGVFVVTGSYYYNQLRFREFAFRYELDKNKRELEETNRKLIELDRLKSRFFANISHELRTPLTLLLSPLETLLHRHELAGDTREQLLTMQNNGMRLLKLINDLLELIRLEAGRLEIKSEPLAINEFVPGIASAVRQMAENKRVRLETSVDPNLKAILSDRDKLEKIVLNLLFNAIKFTPPEGRVELRAEKQDENFVLIVSDTGVGIAAKNLPFVFDRFWQADTSSKRKFQGVGIGLALVKELTEMMNGSVTVQSEESKGATFTIRLPYKKADLPVKREMTELTPATNGMDHSDEWLANLYRRAEFFPAVAATRSSSKPQSRAGHRPSVLVADDEADMRRFLRSELEDEYDLIEAENGLEALEKAEDFRPDIILLDMMMPEMDGLEVCRELRRREVTTKIPVILLTARADEETKFEALEMGANDFLAKPFSSNELQARIKNLIESHHYQRKLSSQNEALTTAIEQIKETEMQLVQSEKLASLGRLSAGIIHEINNPLNFTLTGLFALRNKSKQLAPQERTEYNEILDDVEEGIKRVRNIVSDLRTFTHPGGGGGEIVEVDDAVDAALRFLSGEWKGKVRIEQKLVPQQTVWANRNKLIHVLVNLLQNSIDSLSEKKIKDEEQTIWIEGCVDGARSFISVRDNGMGIDPKLMDKIFDPFFTTKDVG
ncbi:MAG TPA: ATP-binding protein, partial [Candidatus Baltobacteraceae bacterium]|nr:ATP-binding protein [Candidatus Baltobacteraceae bacterium]